MGYQESYVTTRFQEDFSGLCEYIKSIGKDFYSKYGARPVELITLENGCKYIYFVGERYLQSNKERLLGFILEDDEYNSEEQELKMWQWLDKVVIICTEAMNPEGIWEQGGKPVTAKHEVFEI